MNLRPMIRPLHVRTTPVRVLGAAALVVGLSLAAGCASTNPGYASGNYGAANAGYANCYDCGVVTQIEGGATTSKTGAVIGGLIGAVAGREVSAQTGGSKGNQNISTVAGAAAGAVAGNAIAKNRAANNGYGYVIRVRMNDGRMTSVSQADLAGIREGSRVRISNGRAYLQ